MSQRLENGFLRGFCKYLEETEVPSVFALWSAISTVAAVLGRDCFIDMGIFKIYPNLYTVLVGEAASKKSTAISLSSKLLKQIEKPLNLLSQKMTPEALIQGLSEAPLQQEDQILSERAEGYALVSELSTLIDKNSFQNGMIALLTDLWDSPDTFEYRTRSRGKEICHNCCLNILGGSTIQWIKEAIPVVAIGGGFTSRVIFVYQPRSDKLVPFPEVTKEQKTLEKNLVEELEHISHLSGAFHLTPEAKAFYKKDYLEFNQHNEMFDDKHLAGYAGRRHILMLKLSLIISASKRDTRKIIETDLQIALKLLESVEVHLPRVLQAITSEQVGDTCEEVLMFIQKKKILSKSDLMTKFMKKIGRRELGAVLDTLLDCKVIKFEGVDLDNPTIVYVGK